MALATSHPARRFRRRQLHCGLKRRNWATSPSPDSRATNTETPAANRTAIGRKILFIELPSFLFILRPRPAVNRIPDDGERARAVNWTVRPAGSRFDGDLIEPGTGAVYGVGVCVDGGVAAVGRQARSIRRSGSSTPRGGCWRFASAGRPRCRRSRCDFLELEQRSRWWEWCRRYSARSACRPRRRREGRRIEVIGEAVRGKPPFGVPFVARFSAKTASSVRS